MEEEIMCLGDCYFYHVSSLYSGFLLKILPVYAVKVRDQAGVLTIKYFLVASKNSRLKELSLPGSVDCDDEDFASMWTTSRNDAKAIEKLKLTIKLRAEEKIKAIQYKLGLINHYPEQVEEY